VSASQRRKGADGERSAYKLLWEQLGDVVEKRDLSQTRDGGGDIRIPKARVLVEVKRTQRRSVPAWLKQADLSAKAIPGRRWAGVVMWRPNNSGWTAFIISSRAQDRGVYRDYFELTLLELCDWVRGRLRQREENAEELIDFKVWAE